MRSTTALTIVFTALVPACGAAPSPGDGLDADALLALALEEQVRIGSLDDPDVGFSQIGGVQVAHDGRAFVLERMQREIRVYDPSGRLLNTIGRKGAGPGEFELPSGMVIVGDTLSVGDFRNQRVTLFTLDGELLGTVPAAGVDIPSGHPGIMIRLSPATLRPDGLLRSMSSIMVMNDARRDSLRVPTVLFDATGAVVDTLRWDTSPGSAPGERVGNVTVRASQQLVDAPLRSETQGDSIVIERPVAEDAGAGAFTVTRISEGGDTVFHHRFRYRPLPVGAAYEDSIVRSQASRYARMTTDSFAVRRAIRSQLELPLFHPPVSLRRTGRDGSIWLRREDDGGDAWRWIVLGADGTPRGQVAVPRRATIHWYAADEIWAAEPDDFDVPWLVRYRLRPPGS